MAYALLASEREKTVTWQSRALASYTPMHPIPPSPTTPTLSPGLEKSTSGLYAVIPPHMSGPRYSDGITSGPGRGMAYFQ